MGLILGAVSLSANNFSGLNGLKFIYSLDFSGLSNSMVWVEAAGQIFFTLSLGMGAIATYASYVKPKEDVVKAGLYTAGINEFVELVIGASIAIPAAFAMFGALAVPELAKEGTFRIGFMTMPAILMNLPLGEILAFLWFSLLFIAALTSSLALIQPLVAFFEEELKLSHKNSVALSMLFVIVGAHLSALVPTFLDELDFWAGSLLLLVFALVEIVIFIWIFGPKNFYQELTRDTAIKLPKGFVYLTGIVAPFFLLFLGYFWITTQLDAILSASTNQWFARIFILGILSLLVILAVVSKKTNYRFENSRS